MAARRSDWAIAMTQTRAMRAGSSVPGPLSLNRTGLTDETQVEQLEQPGRQLVPPDLPSIVLVEAAGIRQRHRNRGSAFRLLKIDFAWQSRECMMSLEVV
jgi:hypothetical protein